MRKDLLVILLSFILIPLGAQQQKTPQQKYTPEGYPILSLTQCIQMAINCSADVMQAKADSTSAEIQRHLAKSSFMPKFAAELGENISFGRSENSNGVIIDHSASNSTIGIGGSYTLFSGMKRFYNLKEANWTQKANNSKLQGTKDGIILDVIGMYYETLMQEDMIKLSEANIAQTRFHLDYTREMVKGGKWPRSKQLEMEAQLANEKVSMVDNYNRLYLTRLNLALNVDYGTPDSLAIISPDIDNLVDLAKTKLYPTDDVYDYAMANRAEIHSINENREAAKIAIRSAQAGYYPSLSLNLGYNTSYFYPFEEMQRKQIKNCTTQLKHNGRYFIGFTLSIPIFDAFQTANAVRQAKVRYDLSEITHKRIREALFRKVSTAQANATSASKKIAVAIQSARTTKESLQLIKDAFEAGRATPLELEQARHRALAADMQLIQAKYDFVYKTALLEHYMGLSELQ